MKKYIIFFMLIILSIPGYSQRMIYRQKAIEVSGGILTSGSLSENYYVNITLNSFGRHGNYWIWGAEYQKKTATYKEWKLPLENYLGEIGYSLKLLADRKKFITVNAGITGVGGYERVNSGDSILMDGAVLKNSSHFVFGSAGRLSFEAYLSDRMVFLLQGRVRVLWGTDLERFRPSIGAGLRFTF